MNRESLEVNVSLINEKVKFEGRAGENPAITIDYIPPIGDGEGYLSLELLLLSLASCSGSTILALLRNMGKNVDEFKVNAQGIRKWEHPKGFKSIKLEFLIRSKDDIEGSLQKAIGLSEETFCPIWAMLKNNVEIITGYKMI